MTKRSRSANRLRLVENLEPRRLLAGDPIISEFMAANDLTLLDEDGQSSDWIELHNPSDEALTLDGWHLTDDENDLEKWTLPNVTLGPYDYLTVFASDKDRNSLDRNLHTNFKLSADGEYLALTNPIGEVVFSFGDAFPVQSSDVSFGFQTAQFELVGATTPGKSLVPTVSDATADWTDVNFDDSNWFDSIGPIGFDSRVAIDNAGFEEGDLNHWQVFGGGVTVTDSIGISPPQGVYQGLLNGFENAKTQAQLERFLRLDAGVFDVVGGGTASKGSVMKRRFTVEAGDVIEFDWNLLTNEAEETGNADFALFSVSPGVGGIKIGDVQQASLLSESELIRETGYQEFAYTFPESGTFTIGLGIVNMEDESGESSLLLDNIRINGRGDAEGLFTDRIQTDVSDRLQNVNTSIWSRYEFDLDSTDEINSLLIRAQYDDAIAININGQGLTSRNVADAIGWNSVAESDRDESDALRFQDMFVGGAASLLRVGKNVLAVQGLTAGIDDATALFNVQLIGVGAVNETSAYFESPTPGGPNVTSNFNVADPVGFSVGHGIHDRAFELVLTTPTPGASIRYTTDGSVPSSDHGDVYDAPIAVNGTTVVRAVSVKTGLRPSAPATQTYIFLDDTVGQSDADAISLGFPDSWGEFDPLQWPVKEADYEMDRQILGENDRYSGKYKRQIHDSLTAVPTLSLVMDVDDIFGPNGFHRDTRNRGVEWERPTSVELIYPDGTEGFQVDAGIRVQGGISRFISQKQSFRLLFKEEYGESKLDFPFFGPGAAETHDSITLRSSMGELLVNGIHYIRDEQLRRSQRATGNLSSHGTYMHLYINGLYWGLYNPVERMDGQFAANYLGGDKADYDVLNAGDTVIGVSPLQGSRDAWDAFASLTQAMEATEDQSEKTRIYLQLQGLNADGTRNPDFEVYLDRDNLIDYLITQVHSRNADWPIRNYYVLRQRGPESTGFKFLTWDGEFTLDSGLPSKSRITSIEADGIGVVYQGLKTSDLFKTHFSDRVVEHFSPGGAFYTNPTNPRLDPDNPDDNKPLSRYIELVDEVELALVAEAARWGDQTAISAREPFQSLNPVVFTPDERWRPVVDLNVRSFFPTRSSAFTQTLTADDHYRRPPILPAVDASDTTVTVEIESRHGETTYYTTDGSDPLLPSGARSDAALEYTEPIRLTETTTLTTRSVNSDNQWSAVASETYLTESMPADSNNIRITELNYNPHAAYTQLGEIDVDNDEFEFVEIQNISNSPVDLSDVRFAEFAGKGISFTFGRQIVEPGGRVVVPRNVAAFESRYGTNGIAMAIGVADSNGMLANEFLSGISNGGDLITLRDARNRIIQQFSFSDSGDWPGRADGNASSLEVVDVNGSYDDPSNFRSSSEFGGSPGFGGRGPDNRIVINEILANSDGDLLDQIELYNRTLAPIDIRGWYLSDSNNDYLKFQLDADEPLNVGRFGVFDENQTGFRLDSVSGDDVYLIEADADGRPKRFVDRIQFDATAPGVTIGRLPDGSGQLYPMESATLGATNSGPRHGDIVVTEIQYDPGDPDGPGALDETTMEYIEIYNRGSIDVDLTDWRIRGGADYDFAAGTTIGAGETLTLVAFDPNDSGTRTLFNLLFTVDASAVLLGPFDGELDNASDRVRVLRPELPSLTNPGEIPFSLVDEVRYESVTPWPESIGGANRSLHRNDVDAWGNDGRNWQLGAETPTKQNFTRPVPGDFDGNRLVDATDIDMLCSEVRSGSPDAAMDLNGDGEVNLEDHSYLVANVLYTAAGDSNLDRRFDSSDLVLVFIASKYDDAAGDATWSSGDWNCDGHFNSRDIVAAFMTGSYSRQSARPIETTQILNPAVARNDQAEADHRDSDGESASLESHGLAPTDSAKPVVLEEQSVDRLFDRIDFAGEHAATDDRIEAERGDLDYLI